MTAQPRVLLLVPARTYRAADFILAAERMGLAGQKMQALPAFQRST